MTVALIMSVEAFVDRHPSPTSLEAKEPPYYATADLTIYCADCRDVLPSLPTSSVDIVLTDPPYLVDYRGRWGSDWEGITGDSDSSWLVPSFEELWRVLRPDSLCLGFFGWPHADTFLRAWREIGFRPVSQIVCVKDNIGLGYFTRNQDEIAYLLAKGSPSRPATAVSDVFEWEREPVTVHPNQKPLRVISRLLRAYTTEGAVVLDPFMGSGTTLVAARNLRRRAIGIDIEEKYCRAAVQRLSQELLPFEEAPDSERQDLLPFGLPRDVTGSGQLGIASGGQS